MKLYYCAWACIASACFTAAEEPVKTGNDDLIKLLLDNDVSAIPTPPGQPIVPNVEAVAVTPATRQRRGRPFNARAPTSPPAAWFIVPTADLVRRVDESASGQLLRQEGFAVGLASRAESGEYKMHVSTAFKMPSRNFRNLFREHSPPQFGMELTQQLVDTLEMHMPGLFVQGSDRGVFASFDATENQKILLFGREWRVSSQDAREMMSYLTLVKRYFLTLNNRAVVAAALVEDAHVGGTEASFTRIWDTLFGEGWVSMLLAGRRPT